MNLDIPAIPAGVLTLIAFFLPYAQAVLQRPTWTSAQKKLLTIGLSVAVTAIALVIYYAATGDVLPNWPIFILLVLSVAQASYAMLLGDSASRIEGTVNGGALSKQGEDA